MLSINFCIAPTIGAVSASLLESTHNRQTSQRCSKDTDWGPHILLLQADRIEKRQMGGKTAIKAKWPQAGSELVGNNQDCVFRDEWLGSNWCVACFVVPKWVFIKETYIQQAGTEWKMYLFYVTNMQILAQEIDNETRLPSTVSKTQHLVW